VLRRRLDRAAASGPDDEYGLHGYNHVPLTGEYWPDLQTLRIKLQLARDLWDDTMPAPRPTSWVPANNWYDADCLPVVAEVFPEITTVCSLYSSGKYRRGGYREFGPEPWQETQKLMYKSRPQSTMGVSSAAAWPFCESKTMENMVNRVAALLRLRRFGTVYRGLYGRFICHLFGIFLFPAFHRINLH